MTAQSARSRRIDRCTAATLFVGLAARCACATGTTANLPPETWKVIERNQTDSYKGASTSVSLDVETQHMVQVVLETVSSEQRALVEHAPGLDRVAEAAAEMYVRRGQWPSKRTMSWLYWKMGSSAVPKAESFSWASGRNKNARLDAMLRADARKIVRTDGDRLGFGVARVSFGKKRAHALIVGFQRLSVDTLVKQQRPGQTVKVSATAYNAHDDLQVCFNHEMPRVACQTLKPSADGKVAFELTMPSKPGTYFLEARARLAPPREGSRKRFAMFPLYVGIAEPRSFEERWSFRTEPPADPRQWARLVRSEVDAVRADMGLAPTESSSELDKLVKRQLEVLDRKERTMDGSEIAGAIDLRLSKIDGYFWETGYTADLGVFMWEAFGSPMRRQLAFGPAPALLGLSFERAADERQGYCLAVYVASLRK